MMVVLSQHDISRLSAEFQAELQRLLFQPSAIDPAIEDSPFGFDSLPDEVFFETPNDRQGDARDAKRVIDITPEEAMRLIANISDKSLQTLGLFTEGQPIPLDDLVGLDKPYENLTDLKRSFIGAVTRRLRTVTRNKQAALFLQIAIADGAAKAIGVRAASAEALRIALHNSKE